MTKQAVTLRNFANVPANETETQGSVHEVFASKHKIWFY